MNGSIKIGNGILLSKFGSFKIIFNELNLTGSIVFNENVSNGTALLDFKE
jgi:hypothetical protein